MEETELPAVSIITPTRNRKRFFNLTVRNFFNIDYPHDKLEWIIVDDGTEDIKSVIPNDNRIKYYHFSDKNIAEIYKNFLEAHQNKKKLYKNANKRDKKIMKKPDKLGHKKGFLGNRLPIGLKRNMCAQYASNEYIIHMDDDDYYPPSSVKERIIALIDNKVNCVGCSKIGGFHIKKYISVKLEPPPGKSKEEQARNIFEGTLAYTKKYWNIRKFDNQDIYNEGQRFLVGRTCFKIESDNVIVSLYHSENEMMMPIFDNKESNGWHFEKLDDDMFLLITGIEGENKE